MNGNNEAEPITPPSRALPSPSISETQSPATPVLIVSSRCGWCKPKPHVLGSTIDPITLPDGGKLITLRGAALFITILPKAEHDVEEWQAAIRALMLVAEHDG